MIVLALFRLRPIRVVLHHDYQKRAYESKSNKPFAIHAVSVTVSLTLSNFNKLKTQLILINLFTSKLLDKINFQNYSQNTEKNIPVPKIVDFDNRYS